VDSIYLPLGFIIWFVSGFIFLLSTIYYILEMMPAFFRYRKTYINPLVPSDKEIILLLNSSNQAFPKISFQITTRGNEIDVVKRGIKSIVDVANQSSLFSENISILIVTDFLHEVEVFTKYFQELKIGFEAKAINVPSDYTTPNSTMFKARSLQYSIDYRNSNDKTNAKKKSLLFVFYFDAESTILPADFRRIIHSIISSPEKRIFEGPIVYPHKYFECNLLSRQMEATRPFNCHHCAHVMKNPPPIHLHGSNLLVELGLVKEIGWDFGLLDNRPLLAEDLIFGLKVYFKHGDDPFGWHGGRLKEQPPFSVKSSFDARIRWVTGAWQALKYINSNPHYKDVSENERKNINRQIKFRIARHSLSFFAAIFVLYSLLVYLYPPFSFLLFIDYNQLPASFSSFQFFLTRFVFLPGTIFWIFGIIIGALKNLELIPGRSKKIIEISKLLIITPIASVIESFSAFYASIRWLIGKPNTKWLVTSK
jgi:hypothetical protein